MKKIIINDVDIKEMVSPHSSQKGVHLFAWVRSLALQREFMWFVRIKYGLLSTNGIR